MSKRIRVAIKGIEELEAQVNDENPKTAQAVLTSLPIKGNANTWGDEIYFSTSLNIIEEKTRTEVEVGSVAYWPPGKAICIFFGPTPVSKHNEPRAASPVNVFAKILGDPSPLRRVRDNDEVILEKYPE
jgi:hypothetical protein